MGDTPFPSPLPQNVSSADLVSNMQEMYHELQKLRTQVHNQASGSQMSSMVLFKNFYNKPKPFTDKSEESVESFVGHMDLYLPQVPEAQQFGVAVSYLSDDAYNWYQVVQATNTFTSWKQLKSLLIKRFSPINKTKSARDKLAVCKQTGNVATFNDQIQRIIMDIPKITSDEAIDRYLRGLKTYIRTDLCTKEYENLNEIMSDALKIEASKGNPFPSRPHPTHVPADKSSDKPVPMDISNLSAKKLLQREKDIKENACFYCHKPNCRIATCPVRIAANSRSRQTLNNHEVSIPNNPENDKPAQGA